MDTPKVTETEFAILDALWRQDGRGTARAVTEQLYPDDPRKSATVHSLLERLERKDLIQRDRSTYPHTFIARLGRDDYVGGELRRMATKFFSGDLAPILLQLAGDAELSDDERRRVRALLDNPTRTSDSAADEGAR